MESVRGRKPLPQWVAAVIGLVCTCLGAWQLERARSGISIKHQSVGTTPVTIYQRIDSEKSPAVIIAHGFAGSRQLMEAYALTLARSGYVVVSLDFEGHGRNPTAMSGDITRVEGTTRLLSDEVGRVIDFALAVPGADGRAALLGHSMASDIIVRRAMADKRVEATVAISMFSEAVTATEPRNLLVVTGEWETFLRQEALRKVRLVDPTAIEGATVRYGAGTIRRAAIAPGVEHVGVLYSATGMDEARQWLDAIFTRTSGGPVAATGGSIVLLLLGLVVVAWPLSGLLPAGENAPIPLPLPTFILAITIPAVSTPLLLSLVDTRFLPVLVADYLACHLLVYGAISLSVLVWRGVGIGGVMWLAAVVLTAYGIFIFGGALDRYVASFWPIAPRLPIILAIAVGAVPYMLGDNVVAEGGRAALWRVLVSRSAFIASLGAAVALDFQRLFFLLIIIPVIVLFFVIFGLLGGWVGRRTGSPSAAGIALGLILAWALGVSFPMFALG